MKCLSKCIKSNFFPEKKLKRNCVLTIPKIFHYPKHFNCFICPYQDLQKKREEKREENKQKAEEEIAYLQASGKITKKPFKTGLGKKKIGTKPDMRKNRSDNNINEDTNINTTEDSSPEREKKVTNDDVLEDYYQVLSRIQWLGGGGGDRGSRPPGKSQKYSFLAILVIPENDKATKPAFNVGPTSACLAGGQ